MSALEDLLVVRLRDTGISDDARKSQWTATRTVYTKALALGPIVDPRGRARKGLGGSGLATIELIKLAY